MYSTRNRSILFRSIICTVLIAVGVCVAIALLATTPARGQNPQFFSFDKNPVYVYMLRDPQAEDNSAWYSETVIGTVSWVAQGKAIISTSLQEIQSKKKKMFSARGKRSVVKKFFLLESSH